jgi:Homeodomain-like domain
VDYIRFEFPVLGSKFPVLSKKFPVPLSREFFSKSAKSFDERPTSKPRAGPKLKYSLFFFLLYPDSLSGRKTGLAGSQKAILMFGMICSGFLTAAERMELRALARDGLSEARVARRANAIVLLNDGWSCEEVATALLIDDDTVRSWHDLYAGHGLTGLVVFHHQGSQSHLTSVEEVTLFDFVRGATTRCTKGENKPVAGQRMPGAGLS